MAVALLLLGLLAFRVFDRGSINRAEFEVEAKPLVEMASAAGVNPVEIVTHTRVWPCGEPDLLGRPMSRVEVAFESKKSRADLAAAVVSIRDRWRENAVTIQFENTGAKVPDVFAQAGDVGLSATGGVDGVLYMAASSECGNVT